MFSHLFVAAAAVPLASFAGAISPKWSSGNLIRRQMDPDSTCDVYGVDYQEGQSYFININSNDDFTLVEQFEDCNNDTAQIMFVNEDTGDQYECSSIPTVPDDTDQTSTCPVEKSQLVTGNYSILTLGNNGNGNPLAVQRDFTLTVGPQQTVTYTAYAPCTLTVTSTSTVETTTTVTTTSSVPNSAIVSANSTSVQTITPRPVTTETTQAIVWTFYRWTKSYTTVTSVSTASCMVPPRQPYPDPYLHYRPRDYQLPMGVTPRGPQRREVAHTSAPDSGRAMDRGLGNQQAGRKLRKRTPDAPTVTSNTTLPSNSTVTLTADPTTVTETEVSSQIITTTGPPQTIYSTVDSIVTAPTPTYTSKDFTYTLTYVTRTMSITWSTITTTTPTTSASACKCAGGHFW